MKKKKNNKTIIYELRVPTKKTASKVASDLNIPLSIYSKYENGYAIPTDERLFKILNYFMPHDFPELNVSKLHAYKDNLTNTFKGTYEQIKAGKIIKETEPKKPIVKTVAKTTIKKVDKSEVDALLARLYGKIDIEDFMLITKLVNSQ